MGISKNLVPAVFKQIFRDISVKYIIRYTLDMLIMYYPRFTKNYLVSLRE